MMSNFNNILKNSMFKPFAKTVIEAENSINKNTVTCTIMCRKAIEQAIKWLYANDQELDTPYQESLSSLVYDLNFKNKVDEDIFSEISYIIKYTDYIIHSNKPVKRDEAMVCLKYLYDFMSWIAFCYDENYVESSFDASIYPNSLNEKMEREKREKIVQKLFKSGEKINDLKEERNVREKITKERIRKKEAFNHVVDDISEFETRKRFIDIDLEIAGWRFGRDIIEEQEVSNMTQTQDKGYVDYVLYGKDGKPLAVVEAKRTSIDARYGKQQAKLYADCLEREYGQRPIIFYTNGKEIYMWDDLEYPERKVAGFYTQDELQIIINRRNSKESLEHVYKDKNIAGRPYQLEAIERVCETFEQKHRKALLVMATGTGKTRTAISIVDILLSKNWVKNILFLADRTELVSQAQMNFQKFLPDLSCCNLLSSNSNNPEYCRMIFSTYQTMINCIDTVKNENENKLFTPGHFDLIIIDEAHRSIYKKYQAIFEYFDGLLVGLTATPRNDVDRNTYRFFELEDNVPTFAYEYDEAVQDGYLVNYHSIKTSTKFLSRGIKYNELKDEDKEQYENLFSDEETMPGEVSASAITSWLFNRDTIKKVLETLMDKGLKVEGGDKIGKTIIFARNHNHALEIEKVFKELYPQYSNYIEVIDTSINHASSLIDQFKFKDKFPQIAVSVDMLDTGVDVPEVLNLVFFKPVKSKIKFWQMIGRGTRLCKDIYGDGEDKDVFYIFDCCGNFEFFSENERGIEAPSVQSLTEKLYILKLKIVMELERIEYQEQDEYVKYRNKLVEEFVKTIKGLNIDRFYVRNKVVYIDKYKDRNRWRHIDSIAYNEIKENLIPIFISEDDDEYAKRFDCIIYNIQLGKMMSKNVNKYTELVGSLMDDLKKLGTIPQVIAKKDIIERVSDGNYWMRANFFDIEDIRKELRDLIKFIDHPTRSIKVVDIIDTIDVIDLPVDTVHPTSIDRTSYKKKVTKFLNSNIDNIIIYKIKHNEKLTDTEKKQLEKIMFEELGNNSEYIETFGNKNVVEVVRNIVGLDKETANEIFSKYINDNRLNSKQIQFVKLLIDYVTKNGTVSIEVLNEDPFSSLGAITEVFEDNVSTLRLIKKDIDDINSNAGKLA